MLSRVADALYWMGRYIERAENVCRLILVATEISAESEGLDEDVAQMEWDTLLNAVPGSESARLDYSPAAGLGVPYTSALLLDANNPVSVHYSIGRARENARVTREAITREVYLNLNSAYRELDAVRRKRVTNPTVALEAVSNAHRAVLTTKGAIEHTLSRDQGWSFLRLGEAVESTSRTTLVLLAKLPGLGGRDGLADVATPLLYARRRALLRSLSSLEAYRRVQGTSLAPQEVVEFLVFDPEAPRSIRSGVSRIAELLDRLPEGSDVSRADRIIGRLKAELLYNDEKILADPDIAQFLDHVIQQLIATHEAVSKQYFEV